MTRKLFITVILGAGALLLAAQSALAKPPEVTSLSSAVQARENALGRDFQLGDPAVNNTWRVDLMSARPSAIQARQQALGRDFQLGDFAVNNTWRVDLMSARPSAIQARENALGRDFQLGDFAVNNTWRGALSRAQTVRAEPVDFWNYESGSKVADSSAGVAPEDLATLFGPPEETPVAVTPSDSDIEWPQLGVGLSIGIVLALGLGLAMRIAHVRPFAH